MKRKKCVALSLLIALVLCIICNSGVSKAETTKDSEDTPTVVKTCSCIINGTERVLTLLSNGKLFFEVKETGYSEILPGASDVGFDKLGTVYSINLKNNIRWWNYDLESDAPGSNPIFKANSNKTECIENVEKLLFDKNNEFVIGFTTFSGETYPTLTLDEMKEYLGISNDDPTPTPAVPTPTPTNTDKPLVTQEPTVSPQPTVAPKVSLKKQSGYTCLSVGNKVVSKYKLKKGVLTWKGTKKSMKIKQVKQVGYIEKSQNLIYMTKKGGVYTISQKGKKKTILKKGAKKLIFKNRYVTKIKKKSGYTNVVNK